MNKSLSKPVSKSVAKNRRAYHDYEVLETVEAGILLRGSEIKAVREGGAQLKGSYVTFLGETPLLTNVHIAPYKPAAGQQHDPTRSRRLLLKKSEIARLFGMIKTQGVTIVPLELYIKGKWAKVLIGVVRGKKLHDKRRDIKERETKLRAARAVGRRR